jgi:hypothetical protein
MRERRHDGTARGPARGPAMGASNTEDPQRHRSHSRSSRASLREALGRPSADHQQPSNGPATAPQSPVTRSSPSRGPPVCPMVGHAATDCLPRDHANHSQHPHARSRPPASGALPGRPGPGRPPVISSARATGRLTISGRLAPAGGGVPRPIPPHDRGLARARAGTPRL